MEKGALFLPFQFKMNQKAKGQIIMDLLSSSSYKAVMAYNLWILFILFVSLHGFRVYDFPTW